MEFEYKLTLEDYNSLAFIRYSFKNREKISDILAVLVIIFLNVLIVISMISQKQYLENVLTILCLWLIYFAYRYLSKPNITRKLTNMRHSAYLKKNPHLLSIQKIKIENNEVFHTTNNVTTKIKFDKISKVVIRDDLIVALFANNIISFAVPFSAFSSISERDFFIEKINVINKGKLNN